MKADLHIHTALSPCASDDMTPNNIVNMAYLKGLDAIAITDHNSSKNVEAAMEVAKNVGIKLIPGMEIQSKEDIHIICLFRSLESLFKLQSLVDENLNKVPNRPDIFGNQIILDSNDNKVGYEENLLLSSVNLSVEQILNSVAGFGGVPVPAHIDRQGNGMIGVLGFIPDDLPIEYLEISRGCDRQNLLKQNKYLSKYILYTSSDAHALGNIFERDECSDLTPIDKILTS